MGSNTPKRNRRDQTTAERALLEGLLKHAQTVPSLLIAGVWIPNGEMIATLQARLDTAEAVQSTRGHLDGRGAGGAGRTGQDQEVRLEPEAGAAGGLR